MIDIRLKFEVYDYTTHTLSTVLETGRPRYFHNVISGQVGYNTVIGNGSSAISALPFAEEIVIQSSSNVDLEDLRITGNRIKILNTGSSVIEIEIGTTANSRTFYLWSNKTVNLQYTGSVWVHEEENVIEMSDSDLILDDMTGPTKVILPSSGITANRTVTLPTLADNQNITLEVVNKNTTYSLTIGGEGSETINGKTNIGLGLEEEWCKIDNDSSGWNTYERSHNFYSIPEASRTGFDLSAGTATTFTDIDFSSYLEHGRRATAVLLKVQLQLVNGGGNGQTLIRKNGSTETTSTKLVLIQRYRGSTSGTDIDLSQVRCECDEDAIVEYKNSTASNYIASIGIEGYWYK